MERLTNVKVQGRCRVLNIIVELNTGAATGICYRAPDGNVETLQSDLIIDASGNGSLTLEFLKDSGRRAPKETSIGVGRLAARDAAVFELLMDVRNLLKPRNVLDAPSIVGGIENEVASELSTPIQGSTSYF